MMQNANAQERRVLTILVGASRGYGKAIAKISTETLEQASKEFTLFGRDIEGMKDTKRSIEAGQSSTHTSIHQLDLSGDVNAISAEFTAALESISLRGINSIFVFFNAGLLSPNTYSSKHTAATIETSVHVNVTALAILNTALLKWVSACISKDQSIMETCIRIIQISSKASVFAIPSLSLYCAGKAARDVYFKCVAKEIQQQAEFNALNIKYLSWSPGPMETDMYHELLESDHFRSEDLEKPFDCVGTEESARKMWMILLKDSFNSGDVIDLFDV